MKLMVITSTEVKILELNGLMTIGGESSGGHKFTGLKDKVDYAVVSLQNSQVTIIPLNGNKKNQIIMTSLQKCEIKDLTLVLLPQNGAAKESSEVDIELNELFCAFETISKEAAESKVYNTVLRHLLSLCDFDRGLIIAKNADDKFEVVSHIGTDPTAPWLSESLLSQTLEQREPIFISNLIGSSYEKNYSLMATGFLSVAAWPLIWNNKIVGTLMGGSALPHEMKSEKMKKTIQILSTFAAQYVSSYIQTRKLERSLKKDALGDKDNPFTTDSKKFSEVIQLARKISPSDLNVHIMGETGTGKEVLANWIHAKAFSTKSPFIPVNCGALPENLIESILFGHKKGSFTGATTDQTGKFIMAHGGTLFLDEIGDLPLHVQGKLLRVLQEKQVEPIGSNKSITVDVRVVCASHKNLFQMVKDGKFREDLYYRLAEVTLEIPPLRKRPEDISLIAHEFIQTNYKDKNFSLETIEWLSTQDWLGNVRELLSTLKRACLLSSNSEVLVSDLERKDSLGSQKKDWLGSKDLETAVKEFQSTKVLAALKKSSGNRNSAAKLLGINPRTLFRHLESIRQDRPELLEDFQ